MSVFHNVPRVPREKMERWNVFAGSSAREPGTGNQIDLSDFPDFPTFGLYIHHILLLFTLHALGQKLQYLIF
jgi:hypothetical protein